MINIRLRVPKPHPAQAAVLAEASQFNALCCGRRWGKTVIGIDRVIANATGKRRKVGWFAPTYKLLGDAWRELDRVLEPLIVRSDASDHRMEFRTGSSLECWTLDKPDAGRSRSYHEVIVDEAAMVANLEVAWQQAILPTLTDYDGNAWFLSTPKGTASYFHTLFRRGQDPLQKQWRSWQQPTSTNPYIRPEVIERFREDVTDLVFSQEYLAQFVSWVGAVFRKIEAAVGGVVLAPAAMVSVDWGRTNDFTVFTAISPAGHIVEIDRFRGIEYALQRQRLQEFWRRNGARCWIVAEANSMGGPVIEQLQRDGLPVAAFQTTAMSKSQIIEQLALAFERGTIRIPNDPVLVGELQAFEGKPGPSGMMKYGAPEGIHDDTVMSLAIGWSAFVTPREERQYLDPQTGTLSDQYVPYQISPI